ncbi:MAG: FISUMP domain-containing protein [Bacteroidota bacterium]
MRFFRISNLFVSFTFLTNSLVIAQQFQSFTDPRDGKTYKTVRIGGQTWMAENLKYNPQRGNYFIYNNDPVNYDKYGYLYDWSIACNVCPSGWRLPTNADFLELTNFLGANFKPKMMKTNSWPQADGANNSSGFSGVPGGVRDHQGNFRNIGMGAYFWSSTGIDGTWAYARELGSNAGNWASSEFGTNKLIGMSVRCVQNTSSSSNVSDDTEEVLDDEYVEREFEEPVTPQYSSSHPIKKGITEYTVYKTQYCEEEQDFYYNYTGEYACQPFKTESFKISINIHLNDPMYSEALLKMTNLKTKQVDDFEIEYVEELEDGSLSFVFSIINQPHQFILNTSDKTITWYSEWGHWTTTYYYR